MIAIIDYKMGNLRSLMNALRSLGAEYVVTADPTVIESASHVILPGVGNAARAMDNLTEAGLVGVIRRLRRPVLGICVGMQVMCRHSDEGDVDCIGIFDTRVRQFVPRPDLKVPHTGWDTIGNLESKLFRDVPSGSFVYYVHSFYAALCPDTIATTAVADPRMFSAALKYENFYGTQFHPEKSGETGLKILENFIRL
ncbi:MAG: imidazole glycerol phosphate synthase subunit HisH [Muribaculaceae bacterium]|nr:imidazole glycerol phosphate synthase subunit HisH [Muribaculaceae bacterium]